MTSITDLTGKQLRDALKDGRVRFEGGPVKAITTGDDGAVAVDAEGEACVICGGGWPWYSPVAEITILPDPEAEAQPDPLEALTRRVEALERDKDKIGEIQPYQDEHWNREEAIKEAAIRAAERERLAKVAEERANDIAELLGNTELAERWKLVAQWLRSNPQ